MALFSRRKKPAGEFEVHAAEWIFYLSCLREGMTAFDVGANVGLITRLFSHFVGPSGRVHSFEACGATCSKLDTICRLSGSRNVTVNHAAVADCEGELTLYVYDEAHATWNSLCERPLGTYGSDVRPEKVETVPAVTIDSYCDRQKIESIDLLKIDVEGAEYQALLGASRLFSEKRVRRCTFEFGQTTYDMGNNPEQLKEFFAERDYRVTNLVPGNAAFPHADSKAGSFSMHLAVPR